MYVFIMTMEILHSEFHTKIFLTYIGEKYNILKENCASEDQSLGK